MIDFKITPEGGATFKLHATSRDVLIWEKTGRNNSFAELMRAQRMADLYRIAHIAAQRLGLYSGDLTSFESTCDLEQDPDAEEGSADPTPPGP